MKSMVRFVRNLSLLALGLFLFSPPEALANEKLEEMLKRVSESPELQAIDAASAHTVTDAGTLKTTIADYSKLMARITGQPETQFQSQLMASIGKQGINLGLMAPMLATYDQMSALGHDAADLVSPLIARMNPEMGAILNQNHGSLTDIPDNDFGGMLQRHSDVFDLVKMPMGQLADEGGGGTTFLSGVRPVDMYARNGNPDGDSSRGGRNNSAEERKGPNTREVVTGVLKAAKDGGLAAVGPAAAAGGCIGARVGGVTGAGVGAFIGGALGGGLSALNDGIHRYEEYQREIREANAPSQPSNSNDNGDDKGPDSSNTSDNGESKTPKSAAGNSGNDSQGKENCAGKCPSEDDGSKSRSANPDGDNTDDTGHLGSRGTNKTGDSAPLIIDNGDSTPVYDDGTSSGNTLSERNPLIVIPGDLDPKHGDDDARDDAPMTLPPNLGHIDPNPVGGM